MTGVAEFETNFAGIDAEAGIRLPVEIGEEELHDFWLYGGANYYDHENADEIYGADARFEWRINKLTEEYPGSRLSFIASASWNNIDAFDYGGGIRARIPLGKKARCFNRHPQNRTIDCPTRHGRMDAAVVRRTRGDQTVVQNEIIFDPETDVDMLTVVTVNDTNGSLVLGNPPVAGNPLNFANLTTAAANTNEVLIIIDGDETPPGGYGFAVVDSNTTVLGTGTTIGLEGRATGATYLYNVAGSRPQYTSNVNGPALAVDGTGIHIAGLELNGTGNIADTFNVGIHVRPNSSNIAIEQNVFRDLGSSGILSDGPSDDVRIFNNDFNNIGSHGIELQDDNTNTQIYGNTILDTSGSGIDLDLNNDNALISNNSISNSGGSGIEVENLNDSITVTNNQIANARGNGISFDDNNMNALVRNNSVTNSTGAGIIFHDINDNSIIELNTVDGTGDEGIRFDGPNFNTSIVQNDVLNTGSVGILYSSDNDTLRIADNLVQSTGGSGISIGARNNNFTIENNIIERVGTNTTINVSAIRLSDQNGVLSTNNFVRNNTLTNIVNAGDRGFEFGISLQNLTGNIEISQNDINGANSGGIRMGSQNRNIVIVQNEVDGQDYSLSGLSTRLVPVIPTAGVTTITENGIILDGTNNADITIGNQASILTSGFSNSISNVSDNGISIRGLSLLNPNNAIVIENNRIENSQVAGVFLRRGTTNASIIDNEIHDSGIGIRLMGGNNLNHGNDNVSIQDNQIFSSVSSGIAFNNRSTNINLINNRIETVFGTNNNNGDALSIDRNNNFMQFSGNVIAGLINDDIVQIGNNNNFTNSALNLNNNASGAAFAAGGASVDCQSGAGNIGNITLVPVGGGAAITCP